MIARHWLRAPARRYTAVVWVALVVAAQPSRAQLIGDSTSTAGARLPPSPAAPGSPTASSRYRYPVPLGPSDRTFWTISAAALVGSALLDHPARDAIYGYRTPFLDRIAPLGDVFGTAKYTVPTVTAVFVAAHLSRNVNWEDATRHIALSYVLADATEALLKGAVGRQRPDYSGSAWRFQPLSSSDEWHSFPSGHVTHITAIAAAFAEEAHRPWITAVSTGAVMLTAWQRIYRNQHWASDVIGGAIIGVAASRVTANWLRHKRKASIGAPPPNPLP